LTAEAEKASTRLRYVLRQSWRTDFSWTTQ